MGEAPISCGVRFRAWNKDCRRTIVFKPHMLDRHDSKFRASAKCIISNTYERGVAVTRNCGRAGGDDLDQNNAGEAANLFGPAWFQPRCTTHRESHGMVLRWGWQIIQPMRERNSAKAALNGRNAMPLDLVIDKFGDIARC